ncbi:stigma-specific STIG1-like protein 1 [Rosa sericea]
MKSLKVFLLVVAMLMALAVTLSATLVEEELFSNKETKATNDQETFDDDLPLDAKSQGKTSLRGTSSVFLGSREVTTSSCDKNPKVCRAAANSPKSHCCHNKCVDVKTDRLNCGKCGVKCKHAEICCNGHVVHTMSDKKHCGNCDNHCKRGGSCAFGMCSYA